jgi:hypothetical protein
MDERLNDLLIDRNAPPPVDALGEADFPRPQHWTPPSVILGPFPWSMVPIGSPDLARSFGKQSD